MFLFSIKKKGASNIKLYKWNQPPKRRQQVKNRCKHRVSLIFMKECVKLAKDLCFAPIT